jgi:diguanylate cyclase
MQADLKLLQRSRAAVRSGPTGGRLARRLFLLFVAAALLPLLLSDWLALSAIHRIADELQDKAHVARTREISRQVLDRLLSARDLMAVLPAPAATTPEQARRLPGVGTHFLRLQAAGDVADRASALPTQGLAAEPGPQHVLAVEPAAGGGLRVTLSRQTEGRPDWRAELDPQSLWRPITEGAADTRWRVLDAHGRVVFSHEPEADTLAGKDTLHTARVTLPLDGLLAGGSWQFVHQAPDPGVLFLGAPLSRWLALLGAGTVFGVALLAFSRIRHIFRPLEALAEGTRRLASGETQVRVVVQADRAPADEVDDLAAGFNHMADRIEVQLQTLRDLAAIDHDILRGAPMQQLAERLLQQLCRAAPGCEAVLSWREAPVPGTVELPPLQAVRTPGCHPAALGESEALPPEFPLALPTDTVQDTTPSPLWPTRPAGWQRHSRSVVRDGSTCGLIALVAPAAGGWGPRSDERLDALRDRLAVSLAARQRDSELAWRATHDSLTGLLNRLGLHEHLDRQLAAMAAGSAPAGLALVLLDLDHFKDLNDSRGHDVGDELLRQVALRLQAALPANATVARLGGDEFVALLPDTNAAEALRQANLLTERLRSPFEIQGITAVVGASAGIALAPEHAHTRLELARRADIALYSAKAQRGTVCLFEASQDAAAAERSTRATELRHAIGAGELRVHYQPRVSASGQELMSVEALVRWQHPQLGLLSPARFIDIAERAGLIDALGQEVLDQACRQMAAWQATGVPVRKVSVNVSMQQLRSGKLPAQVLSTLARHGLAPAGLELEITESLLADDSQGAVAQLQELHDAGIEIALDDFGTGYSAMSQLRKLPIDVMKIDRSFVADLERDDGAMAIARAIVALAGALDLRVVAEGVETEAQATILRELGCHELQGYLFAPPLPPEKLAACVQAGACDRRKAQTVAAPA